jgi:hypothetical protein
MTTTSWLGALFAAREASAPEGMTPQAWVFMTLVWAVVIGMTAYCFFKLMISDQKLGGPDDE